MVAKGSRKLDGELSELDVKRRATRARRRELRHVKQGELARRALGDIEKGMEVFGLTRGRFSLINLIEEVLKQVGGGDLWIATWTVAVAEIGKLKELRSRGLIGDVCFLMDDSFPSRQPEYCRMLMEAFGEDRVLAARSHAKFVIIRNDCWNVVIRTSMNLSENKLIEFWEVSDDAAMAEFLCGAFDRLYQEQLEGPNAKEEELEVCEDLESMARDDLELGGLDFEVEDEFEVELDG